MLNYTQCNSIDAAVKYFETDYSQGDYYLGAQIEAIFGGKAADLLGLDTNAPITKKQFKTLLSGKHPETGAKLAQRLRSDRRPGTDLTFSVPKSVSLAWAINKDERIIEMLQDAVRETIAQDIEPLVHRRVRKGENANTLNRTQTGNLLYADFLHKVARPVDGHPDPFLHVHAFLINLTEDDGTFYAAEFNEIFRQLPSLQAKFHSRLARKLQSAGYQITHSRFKQSGRMKHGWELAGITRETIEKFSRRTQQVEDHAQTHGITDAKAKGDLGRETRGEKDPTLSIPQLRSRWNARLTSDERAAFAALRAGAIGGEKGRSDQRSLEQAVSFALDHHLQRQATTERHTIVGTALSHNVTLDSAEVEAELDRLEVICRDKDVDGAKRHFITTREVLDAEQEMIAFARDTRGTRYTMAGFDHTFKRDWLDAQQKDAVNHVLSSRCTVTAVTGGAGTGKTSLMKEAIEAIEASNRQVFTFAPTSGAREVLEEEGFASAQTVAHLTRNKKLHAEFKSGDVLWIDEAGLLDVRTMNAVFAIAKQRHARIVLSGDTRQHSGVGRGEAMRLLETYAGINAVRVDTIKRQKGRYKQAIELISRGTEPVHGKQTGLDAGFSLLDKLGKIKEIAPEDRHAALAEKYLDTTRKGRSTLVIAPTNAEKQAVTQEIRDALRAAGAIGGRKGEEQERAFMRLQALHLSEAEKGEEACYTGEGQIVQFHQNAKGFKKGERYRVHVSDAQVSLVPLSGQGEAKPLPREATDRFDVYAEDKVSFAVGDKVRFSLGGLSQNGKRISNGRLDEVSGFGPDGSLKLKSGMVVAKDFAHLDLGYCITSHASQGKTTDVALAAMGSQSTPAINAKQFYVTASRASKDLMIFVDDKRQVRRAIQDSGEQLSASELTEAEKASPLAPHQEIIRMHERRRALQQVHDWWQTHRPELAVSHAPAHVSSPDHRRHNAPTQAR